MSAGTRALVTIPSVRTEFAWANPWGTACSSQFDSEVRSSSERSVVAVDTITSDRTEPGRGQRRDSIDHLQRFELESAVVPTTTDSRCARNLKPFAERQGCIRSQSNILDLPAAPVYTS